MVIILFTCFRITIQMSNGYEGGVIGYVLMRVNMVAPCLRSKLRSHGAYDSKVLVCSVATLYAMHTHIQLADKQSADLLSCIYSSTCSCRALLVCCIDLLPAVNNGYPRE